MKQRDGANFGFIHRVFTSFQEELFSAPFTVTLHKFASKWMIYQNNFLYQFCGRFCKKYWKDIPDENEKCNICTIICFSVHIRKHKLVV